MWKQLQNTLSLLILKHFILFLANQNLTAVYVCDKQESNEPQSKVDSFLFIKFTDVAGYYAVILASTFAKSLLYLNSFFN